MTTMVGLMIEYKAKTAEIDCALGGITKDLKTVQAQQKKVETGFGGMGEWCI